MAGRFPAIRKTRPILSVRHTAAVGMDSGVRLLRTFAGKTPGSIE